METTTAYKRIKETERTQEKEQCMMQYNVASVLFLYKDWRRVLCRRWESGALECSLTCQKKLAENLLQKKRKKSKYLLTDRNIGVSMYPY